MTTLSKHTLQAVNPLIERPAAAVVNKILANVKRPFFVRPSAGVSGRTMIISLPGETEDIRSVITNLTTPPSDFIPLLTMLTTVGDTEESTQRYADSPRLNSYLKRLIKRSSFHWPPMGYFSPLTF